MASSGNESYEDIIGPDVDFGFVLAKHGRDGHTIVDAGLASLVGTFGDDLLLRADPHESVETPFPLENLPATFRLAALPPLLRPTPAPGKPSAHPHPQPTPTARASSKGTVRQ